MEGLLRIKTYLKRKESEGLGCNHVVQDLVHRSACEHRNNILDIGKLWDLAASSSTTKIFRNNLLSVATEIIRLDCNK